MYTPPEQFTKANQAALEATLKMADVALVSVERLSALNLQATRNFFENLFASGTEILTVKDLQDLTNTQAAHNQPVIDNGMAYVRGLIEIATETRDQFNQIIGNQVSEANSAIGKALDQTAKSGPTGSEFAVATIKSAFASANTAYESVAKAAKQISDIAESNLTIAANTPVHLPKPAPKGKKAA